MKPSHAFVICLVISLAFTPAIESFGVMWHAKQIGKSVGKVTKTALALPLVAVKKAGFVGHFAIKKAAIASHLALPIVAAKGAVVLGTAKAGAIIGAPVGAIIGAKAGAAAGAALGAKAGIAAIAAKKALLAKAAVVGGALIAKHLLIAAKIKAAILAKKAAIAGHGLSLAGKALAVKGKLLQAKGAKLKAVSKGIIGLGLGIKAKIAAALAAPKLAAPKAKAAFKVPVLTGPKYANVAFQVAHPLTGYRYGQATIGAIRKKRDSETTEDLRQRPVNELITIVQSRNAQQCLAKVICELSADPNFHGDDGVKFGGSLKALSRANHPRAEHFRSASTAGSQLQNPSLCAASFTDCATPSNEVIRIGNSLMNG